MQLLDLSLKHFEYAVISEKQNRLLVKQMKWKERNCLGPVWECGSWFCHTVSWKQCPEAAITPNTLQSDTNGKFTITILYYYYNIVISQLIIVKLYCLGNHGHLVHGGLGHGSFFLGVFRVPFIRDSSFCQVVSPWHVPRHFAVPM